MLLYLKVKPGQRFNKVEKTSEGWQIRLNAPAVDGKANESLLGFLSALLGIPKSAVVLKKGQTSRFKCLEINGDESEVLKILEDAAGKQSAQ